MIRELILDLNEAMKDLGKNALYTSYGLSYLYNPDDELSEALENYDTEGMESKILFVFSIREDIYMDAVWARDGYGPMAYMVAMQMQGSLAPYRQESQVTEEAVKIWKEFFNGKGEKFVTKKLVGDNPSNYRDYEYSLKRKMNLSKNLKLDREFIEPDPYNERRGMMDELAEGILRQSMRGIYNF